MPRVYQAKVRRVPGAETLARLRKGVRVDGERMVVDQVRVLEAANNSWLELVLHEGKHHEVRRLLEAVGHPVSKLRRVALGPVTTRGLEPGEFRHLTEREVRALRTGRERAPPAACAAPAPSGAGVRPGEGAPAARAPRGAGPLRARPLPRAGHPRVRAARGREAGLQREPAGPFAAGGGGGALRARAAIQRYPDGPATALRAALARGLGVAEAQVVIGNGSTELIDLFARAFLGPEDNAVISEGAFARFGQVVRARNGNARLVPMRDRTHDLQAMRAAVDARTRLIYVANPNNPTGTWNRRREVEALLADLPPEVLRGPGRGLLRIRGRIRSTPTAWPGSARAGPWRCCGPSPRPTAWRACAWATRWPRPR